MMRKYNIIYADPAWQYRDRNTGGSYKSGSAQKYQVMSLKDICQLPVKDLAADNAALFIWTTWPMIWEAFQVMTAWGFTYKTVGFVWIKMNRKSPSLFWGCGHWTRSNSEVCLMAVKGSPKRISASVHQVIEAPVREHSQKPDEARERIVQLLGDLPRIELFARQKVAGWDAWGNEIESDIQLVTEEALSKVHASGIDPADHQRRKELYDQNLSDREIGEILHYEKNTIAAWRKRNNLPPVGRHGRKSNGDGSSVNRVA